MPPHRPDDPPSGDGNASHKIRVSVVVPAYNAGRWIGRTLKSVQEQSVSDLEIIVVDDGSTDETARIVREFQKNDPRIVLIEQANGGVAKARNAGIAAARSDFVAPLDGDDLWHPKRLELHLQAFAELPGVALVYSPSVLIDDNDRIITSSIYVDIQGNVFEPHLCFNFIGNGSSITVRTNVARDIGGYSSELKSRGGQGCEDWLFQLRVAYRNKFACVPFHLVGYRTTDENMSSDSFSMRRSGVEAMREIEAYAAALPRPLFWWPQARMNGRLVLEYAKMGRWRKAISEFVRFTLRNPLLPSSCRAWLPFDCSCD